MHTFTRHLRPPLPAIGLIAMLVVLAGPIRAQAVVTDREHYSFTDSFQDVICGVEVRHDTEDSGIAHIRVGKNGLASAFFGINNYEGKSTLTNEANGNFLTIEHNGNIVDTTGKRVSGTVFKFTTLEAGQPIVIRDMTGQVVSRDAGVIRETYLFDTLGDDTLGGLYLEQLGLLVKGPHPLLPGYFDEEAFCAIVQPLLLG